MRNVPDGWRWEQLADVLLRQSNGRPLQQGWSPRCLPHPSPDPQTWAVLKTTAIQDGWFDDAHHKELPETLDPRPPLEVRSGDLLMTCAGPRSRCGVATLVRHTRPRLMLSGKMYRFRPTTAILAEFLEYWLRSPEAQRLIDAMKTGISDSGLNLTHDRFGALPVPVPAVDEQRRIVEILDDHFSRLDAAMNDLHRQLRRIESLRSSAVDAAVHPRDGDRHSLASLLATSIGGVWGAEPGADEVDVSVLRVTELKRHGELDARSAARRSISAKQLAGRQLRPGDLLLEKSGGGPTRPVGRVGLVRTVDGAAVCANFMQLMRPDVTLVVPRFLHLVLDSFHRRGGTVPMQKATTNIRNLKMPEYLATEIPVPSLERQRRILEVAEPVIDACRRLEAAVLKAEQRDKTLKTALLRAAFDGRLTKTPTQDKIEELSDAEASTGPSIGRVVQPRRGEGSG